MNSYTLLLELSEIPYFFISVIGMCVKLLVTLKMDQLCFISFTNLFILAIGISA